MSGLYFANPAGFWALAALPLILLIHFFQQPSRRQVISTFFLWERMPPESLRGTVFERLLSSLPLWLQLLCALLVTWLLVQPRWIQQKSEQQVVLLLDSSASMSAFRSQTTEALKDLVDALDARAQRTRWLVMGTGAGEARLYEGNDRGSVVEALTRWRPIRGRHDFQPAFELASLLKGNQGTAVFLTDSRSDVPVDFSYLAVGASLPNCGFVGADAWLDAGECRWKAVLRNFSDSPAARRWRLFADGKLVKEEEIQLDAGKVRVIGGTFPEGAVRVLLEMEADRFSLDDCLPMVRPQGRRLNVAVEASGRAGDVFRKVAQRFPDVTVVDNPKEADLVVADSLTGYEPGGLQEGQALIMLRRTRATPGPLEKTPVVAEAHPMVDGLRWQGLLSSGAAEFSPEEDDQVLLWQQDKALVFLRTSGSRPCLMINFDLEYSNAERVPAFLIMLHRFFAALSEHQSRYAAMNLLAGSSFWAQPLEGDQAVVMQEEPLFPDLGATGSGGDSGQWWAPLAPGYFRLQQQQTTSFDGASYFADPFESDLSRCQSGGNWEADDQQFRETHSLPDPLRLLWILLLLFIMAWIWWLQPGRAHGV